MYIFDDLICESKAVLRRIGNLYVQGRNKQVSLIFLSQSYFDIDKLIRKNANYIIIKKVLSTNDFGRMMREYGLKDIDEQELISIYKQIISQGMQNWLMLDLQTSDTDYKYRFNFDPLNLLVS